ncbi:MAG TPA: hypothetical protein VGD62_03145 [Acidobacteriaceae bacterium]
MGKEQGLLLRVAAIALGLQAYAVMGAEFQYDIYSLAFAPATFFCIVYRLQAGAMPSRPVS